jgi:hypothetical protein
MGHKQNQYEIEENILSSRSDAFIQHLVQHGLIGKNVLKKDSLDRVTQHKKKSIYHNTLLLLQNYRNIIWLMECFPEQIAEDIGRPLKSVEQILQYIDDELDFENRRLEIHLKNMQKTKLMLDQINEALSILKKKPRDGERLYALIYETYINPECLLLEEILNKLYISSRSYYRLRQQAIHIISLRLWSAPSQEIDGWLDMLALLEIH